MVELEHIELAFSDKKVLSDVSLNVKKGETVLLVGNSGAGKSTILKLILGLIKPDAGQIKVFGEYIEKYKEKDLLHIRQRCGMIFQGSALFDSLNVRDNIGFFLHEHSRLTEEEINRRIDETLNFLDLPDVHDVYPDQLSGGMKKRVAVARAIVSNPDLLLYDEPTAGLDPVAAHRVVNLISTLKNKLNVTSIIVSHEYHYFLDIVDRMIMLRGGRIVYNGKPSIEILKEQFAAMDETSFEKMNTIMDDIRSFLFKRNN